MNNRYCCFVILLGLTGCATIQDCDPRYDPGLFGSIYCHSSGMYKKRIEQQEKKMAKAQANRDALLGAVRKDKNISNQLDTEIKQTDAELKSIDQQLLNLKKSVKSIQGTNSAMVIRISELHKKIKVLRSEIEKSTPNKNELKELQQEKKRLQKELKILQKEKDIMLN